MIKPEIPLFEKERLEALLSYDILDTGNEDEFDEIATIASKICNTPISLINFVEKDKQWSKSSIGIDVDYMNRDISFCGHAINDKDNIMIVENTDEDERFHDNPLTIDPKVRFYAGVPLNSPEGLPLGAICVLDYKPNNLDDSQKEMLKLLASHVMKLLNLRKTNSALLEMKYEADLLNQQLDAFAYRVSHDLRAPLRGVSNIIQWIKTDQPEISNGPLKEDLDSINDKVVGMQQFIGDILRFTRASSKQVEYSSFNLSEFVEQIKDSFQDSNANFTLSYLNINVNQPKMVIKSCLENLISNSLKYCKRKGIEIFISSKIHNNTLIIIYEDNGPGIPENLYDKVFDFFSPLKKNSDSTGLGFSIINTYLTKLGGDVYLKNRDFDETGICVVMKFPFHKNHN